MASYAIQADVDDLYGEDLLVRVADHDGDDIPDPDIVESGLAGATNIINSYISARYQLPLSVVPGILKTFCIDIGVYKMALTDTRRTAEMRQRYVDAMQMLKDIAKGEAGLGIIPTDDDGDGNPDQPESNAPRRGRSINVGRA
jgi:phage gp36-like protein